MNHGRVHVSVPSGDLALAWYVRVIKAALLALPVIAATLASGEVTITPSAPKALEPVRLVASVGSFGSGSCGGSGSTGSDDVEPNPAELRMSGNRITVVMQVLPCVTGTPRKGVDVPLGTLPTGTYDVDLYYRPASGTSPDQLVARRQFTVAATSVTTRIANYSDIWWNETESGWGLNITHHPSQQFFITWFVYGENGEPRWYVLPGNAASYSGHFFSGTVYRTNRPVFSPAFDPSQIVVTPAGTGTVEFDTQAYGRAQMRFTVDGVTFQKAITRQPF